MKVGIFPMAADLLHSGHVIALEEAKKNCDYLIVGLNCCPHSGVTNKNQPTQSVFERYNQLRAVKYVDEIVPYENEEDLLKFLGSMNYDVRFVGEDHRGKPFTGDLMEAERGIETIYLSRKYHGLSSTELRCRIYEAELKRRANDATCK